MRARSALPFLAVAAATGLASSTGRGADIQANPGNYAALLPTLKPGDTLHLAAGTYAPTGSTPLLLSNLNGSSGQWITVTGPAVDPPTAVFQASPDGCCNIVEIDHSSFVSLEHLRIDGRHVSGAFGVSAGGGAANVVHDVRILSNTFVNIDNDGTPADLGQQDDAISTKTPTWNWLIQGNRIVGPGTGMYLGNSDGSDPFVAGIIDDNLVDGPTGYCIEIKQQNTWPTGAGLPAQPTVTIVSNNVFIKRDHAATPSGARPQVLVDGFPTSGPGSQDHYEIYGNLFFHDSDDYLLQATGRAHVHDNLFVDDPTYGAIHFTDHAGFSVIDAIAYNNTIYAVGTGIALSSAPTGAAFVVGNAVFASTAFSGMATTQKDNVTDSVASAGMYLDNPGVTLGTSSYYPKAGSALRGAALDLSSVSTDVDYDRDFNGTKKDYTYRGAYSGEGQNPGWPPSGGIKDGGAGEGGTVPPGGGMSDGGGADGSPSSPDAGVSDVGGSAKPSASGCGCTTAGREGPWAAWLGWAAAAAVATSRGRRRYQR